ncbi:CRISPR-associated endonuclease/helicase Cas3 [Salinibacter ruber]|uniref:CRISPR-associated helicase Cas3' n=1 Tax=Salinibacter ruber TaxID=146919 RepID=UPI00216AB192|nr:CRISPR-associated helicase Cas3' [Salinibacter ruber]MCS3827545.1 CRISPR-associated endonuclease/helicase Cas3 [Salinibacter ruber]
MAWAKKDRENPDVWHSVLAHSAEVAAVFRLLATEAGFNTQLARIGQEDLWPLVELAFYHDAGKVSNAFQDRTGGHLRPIIALLSTPHGKKYLSSLPLQRIMGWFSSEQELVRMLKAAWSHHGEPVADVPSHKPKWWTDQDGYSPTDELKRLGDFADSNFEHTGEISYTPELENFFAGLLTLADWIGSDRRYFPYENGQDDGLWGRSLSRAEEALGKIGLLSGKPRAGLSKLLGEHDPYDIQSEGTRLEGDLVFAESPTGSGKTELAVGRYLRMHREGKVDGMYFAVPTRAAAKQLHGRVHGYVQDTFSSPPPVVQAVPGYIKVGDEHGVRAEGLSVEWNGEVRGWAAETSKRYTASPIAVGTVDQALLSGLQEPHAHMRMAGLSSSLLVVDEVHSLSHYMNIALRSLLGMHIGAGGRALLMSATVSSKTRSFYFREEMPPLSEAKEDVEYPYVTNGEKSKGEKISFPAELEKTVEVEVRRAEDPDAAFAKAIRDQTGRGRVLGIRNRVPGAIAVQQAIGQQTLEAGGKEVPHHSRYAQPDRQLLDQAIEDAYDEDSDVDQVTTIATQTVEQSLDIDSDVMVTDLAPMPTILQRIGRLWRHPSRERPPGIDKARCIVIAPRESFSSILEKERHRRPIGLGTVYADLRELKATLGKLEDTGELNVPGDCRELVEESTHPEALRRATPNTEAWDNHVSDIAGSRQVQEKESKLVAIDWATGYSQLKFTDDTVQTRMGDLPYTIGIEATTPFGNEIEQISIPTWMFGEDQSPEPSDGEVTAQESDRFEFTALDKTFVYDKYGFRPDGS